MDTFEPSKIPTTESTASFTANTYEAGFGDGYEQVVVAGLNSIRGAYQLSWDALTLAERDEIEGFFRGRLGAEAFSYTFPGELTPRKFRCKTWTRGHNGGLYTVRAELREVFDLE